MNTTPAALQRLSLLALLPTFAACAVTTHSAAPTDLGEAVASDRMIAQAAEPGPVQLTQVVAADWAVDRGGLINLDHPKAEAAGLEEGMEDIQIFFYVLEHPTRGTFLIDTGVAESFRRPDDVPVSALVAAAMNMEALKIHVDTRQWIAANGPVQGVFLTHLHLDHIMGLPDLPQDTPVYTGPGEAAASQFMNMFVQGTTDDLLEGLGALQEWRFAPDASGRLDGVLDVFGDGTVFAIHVPGHTPGSTAFLVRTPQGPQLIVGDASHTTWGWEHGVEPGFFNMDGARSVQSLGKLKALEEALPGVIVHIGHQHHAEHTASR